MLSANGLRASLYIRNERLFPPDQHVIKTVRPVDIASDELLINIEASFLAVNLGSIYNNVWPVFDKLFTWFENNSLESNKEKKSIEFFMIFL